MDSESPTPIKNIPPNDPPVIPETFPVKSKSNRLPLIVAMIISAVLSGIGGFYAGKYIKSSTNMAKTTPEIVSITPTTSVTPLPSNTIEEVGDSVVIHFNKCEPDTKTVYTGFGSTMIEVEGVENEFCKMKYEGEVENPEGVASVATNCLVPVSLNTMTFNVENEGVNFTSIGQYCTK